MNNQFFIKRNNVKINDILALLKQKKIKTNFQVNNIKELHKSDSKDISFLHSTKYLKYLKKTKSKVIITNPKCKKFISEKVFIIEVPNVLLSVAKITLLFYPTAFDDVFDKSVKELKSNRSNRLQAGQNVLVGKNVKIGKNCSIGHNSILEQNVVIGDNCKIGNNVIIKHSIIGKNTNILDGAIVGKKGFGFFPGKLKNIRYPHIGAVIIGNNVEIGCNNTIDRGSLSNTIIGDGTFLDNQVHIAHNVKIGKNCIITGQVGFAGSSIIGNNVMIGGQAGISGHLIIGDKVQIGGGSGVIKNIPSNTKVMGYPAKDIRKFLKDNKLDD
ncbi:MAG: UDP-3-O-(3-hydroxymyristoyl)glucosamine N-acyltransferase [Candidatus Pelagibacter sp.]|nr:UDP-3-O-(3-hydroxymyristoyl)glucosamine N-acyltransferase [Candidatus Pelagibacter sp.]|tara:strand:+ start:5821 stop:6801 length:981 start_codon:yes stop_codon:yes gene_type:complete